MVFDTNIYRGLDPGRAQALKDLERSRGVVALAAREPTLELGSHLGDEADCNFKVARRALAALWHHTKVEDGSDVVVVPMLHDSDSQLALGLFGQHLHGRRQEADDFGWALGALGSRTDQSVPEEVRPLLVEMRQWVAEREKRFTEAMLALVKTLDPNAEGWQPNRFDKALRADHLARVNDPSFLRLIASARVGASAELCGVSLTEAEQAVRTDWVLASFPTPIHFHRNLIRGLIQSGTDFSRPSQANSAWDQALAFVASPDSSVSGVPTVLVTEEKKFHTAAADAGHQAHVLTYTRYRSLLETNGLEDYIKTLPRSTLRNSI